MRPDQEWLGASRWEGESKETQLEEGQTMEEVKQRFTLLREAYEEMRGIDKITLHLIQHGFLCRPNDANWIWGWSSQRWEGGARGGGKQNPQIPKTKWIFRWDCKRPSWRSWWKSAQFYGKPVLLTNKGSQGCRSFNCHHINTIVEPRFLVALYVMWLQLNIENATFCFSWSQLYGTSWSMSTSQCPQLPQQIGNRYLNLNLTAFNNS